MSWPDEDINETALDASSDSPLEARDALLAMVRAYNGIRGALGQPGGVAYMASDDKVGLWSHKGDAGMQQRRGWSLGVGISADMEFELADPDYEFATIGGRFANPSGAPTRLTVARTSPQIQWVRVGFNLYARDISVGFGRINVEVFKNDAALTGVPPCKGYICPGVSGMTFAACCVESVPLFVTQSDYFTLRCSHDNAGAVKLYGRWWLEILQ